VVGRFNGPLLLSAFLDPLTYQQDIHDDGEDKYENGPDNQHVVPSAHFKIPPTIKRTAWEAA
jgi:hypothetical protein